MRNFAVYSRLQLKRAARLLPKMLSVTLLLAVLTALAGWLLTQLHDGDEGRQPVRIAVTGQLNDERISEGLQMLESIDSSRFELRLERMDEAEAERALRQGEIDGLLLVPEGFAEAWMAGEHRPLVYRSTANGASLGARLTRELAESVAALVLESENAVYGAQDFAADSLPGVNPYALGDKLVLRYALRILDRERLFETELDGAAGALSLAGSALAGLTLLFGMLWAMSVAPLSAGRTRELGQLLAARGLRGGGQVLAELTGFALLMLCAMLAAFGVTGLLLPRFGIGIPELSGLSGADRALLLLRALPSLLMLCAQAFLLYELAESLVAGLLLQFCNAAVQGYLAGCLYPAAFFPDGLRRLGERLPAGAAMAHLRALLLGENARAAAAAVWGWLLLFVLAAAALRQRRCRR